MKIFVLPISKDPLELVSIAGPTFSPSKRMLYADYIPKIKREASFHCLLASNHVKKKALPFCPKHWTTIKAKLALDPQCIKVVNSSLASTENKEIRWIIPKI